MGGRAQTRRVQAKSGARPSQRVIARIAYNSVVLEWAIFAALAAAGSGAALVHGVRERKHARLRLTELSHRLDTTIYLRGLTLVAEVDGCHVRISAQGLHAQGLAPSVVIAGRGPLRDVWITAEHELIATSPLIEAPLVRTQDSGLDAHVHVRGSEPYVRALLDESHRRRIYRLTTELGVSIAGGRVVWTPSDAVWDRPDGLSHIARTIRELTSLATALDVSDADIPRRLQHNVATDPTPQVRLANLCTLIRVFPTALETVEAARIGLLDDDPNIRFVAARHLPVDSRRVLREIATSAEHHPELRARAIEILATRFGAETIGKPQLLRMSFAKDPRILAAATRALGLLVDEESETRLLEIVARRDTGLRLLAIKALGRSGTLRAVPSLLPYTRGLLLDAKTRKAAAQAVSQIQKRCADPDFGHISLVDIGEHGQLTITEETEARSPAA
ncbi:MAG: HEAT repeat domain-containing protein [Deltaproteobacteria bacterium]|nr:HEAT repeat domain-containing protein [Deltaproteobacteria bacterium]